MSKITIRKVNDVKVTPVRTELEMDQRPVLGEKLFGDPTANIFLVAKKGSGKTSAISKILHVCCSPNQSVIAIGSTVHQDPVWLEIRKWCKKHKIPFMGLTSIKDGKQDFFRVFLAKLQETGNERELDEKNDSDSESESEIEKQTGTGYPNFFSGGGTEKYDEGTDDDYEYGDSDEEKEPVIERGNKEVQLPFRFPKTRESSIVEQSKFREPLYTIILDDLSGELKCPSLSNFLKYARHFRCRVITSSQYSKDYLPSSLAQQDYILMWPDLPEDKLKKLTNDAGLSLPFDVFMRMYRDATREKHNFLYWNTRNNVFRKNFDQEYLVSLNKQA